MEHYLNYVDEVNLINITPRPKIGGPLTTLMDAKLIPKLVIYVT